MFRLSPVRRIGPLLVMAAAVFCAASLRAAEVRLSSEDRRWLAEHPVIEFACDPAWPPFSERGEAGRYAGIDLEILAEFGRRLGVEFRARDHAGWNEAYRAAAAGEVAFVCGTELTEERKDSFLFTRPYVGFPLVIVTRENAPAFDDLSRLIGGTVASVTGYSPTAALRRDLPELQIREYATFAETLHAVAAGQADATLANLVTARHRIREDAIQGLKIAGVTPYYLRLRYAVHPSRPELRRALDAAIVSLEDDERDRLLARYARLDSDAVVSRAAMLRRALFVGVALLGVALVWGWFHLRLRRELAERLRLQRELEASHARLARLNEEKSGLMRMAAHDLRNPLGGLLLGVDLVRDGDAETRRLGLERMVRMIHQMTRMVRNLLDVEALESGARRVKPEPVALEPALRECLATLEPSAGRKSIALRLEAGPPGIVGQADRAALRQVCDNLVSNALKYSPAGSVVRVAFSRGEPGRVRFRVMDEGPGIRPDEMERLFQRYTCLSARPTGGEASSGLGLSIVKDLVARMGGRVWCESEPGRGATFFVELPEAAADEGRSAG